LGILQKNRKVLGGRELDGGKGIRKGEVFEEKLQNLYIRMKKSGTKKKGVMTSQSTVKVKWPKLTRGGGKKGVCSKTSGSP